MPGAGFSARSWPNQAHNLHNLNLRQRGYDSGTQERDVVHLEFRVYWGLGKPVVLIFREEGRFGRGGGDAGRLVRVHVRHLFWVLGFMIVRVISFLGAMLVFDPE